MDNWDDHLEHELRSDAEESESDAAALAARQRDLTDVVFDAMAAGDLLAITSLDRTYTGVVTYARRDLVSIRTAGAGVDANLAGPLHLVVKERAHAAGLDLGSGAPSFRARLSEYELSGETVEIVAPAAGAALTGRITAVARDHVVITSEDVEAAFVPLTKIAFVVRHELLV